MILPWRIGSGSENIRTKILRSDGHDLGGGLQLKGVILMAGDRIGICSALRVVLTESPGEPGPEVDSGTSRKTKATSLPVT